jgi:hypothetical protein
MLTRIGLGHMPAIDQPTPNRRPPTTLPVQRLYRDDDGLSRRSATALIA